MASFDAGCCTDMKVVFFKPKMPKGQYNSLNYSYGVTANPDIEAGFFMDLSARAIDAVESLKKYLGTCSQKRIYVFEFPPRPNYEKVTSHMYMKRCYAASIHLYVIFWVFSTLKLTIFKTFLEMCHMVSEDTM